MTRTGALPASWLRGRQSAVIAIVGGGLVVAGSMLPWMSFFAGLQPFTGVAGMYGRVLLIGGTLSVAAGVAILFRPRCGLERGVGALGLALAVFASWILVGLWSTIQTLGHHPLLLARSGPGVFVVLAGAVVLTALLVVDGRRI